LTPLSLSVAISGMEGVMLELAVLKVDDRKPLYRVEQFVSVLRWWFIECYPHVLEQDCSTFCNLKSLFWNLN